MLWSQLCRQGGGTAEKHPIWLLFKYLMFPWPLLQRLTSNKAPGGWGLPSHSGYIGGCGQGNISMLSTWAGNTCRCWSTSSGDETTELPERCWQLTADWSCHLLNLHTGCYHWVLTSQRCSEASTLNHPSVPKMWHAAKAQGSPWTPA